MSARQALRRLFLPAFLAAIAISLATLGAGVRADGGYTITLNRDFGYGGLNNDIRGNFTIGLSGDETQVSQVQFTFDGQPMATVSQSPFKYSFVTTDYAEGTHTLGAVVTLKDGTTLTAPAKTTTFVSAAVENQVTTNILVPVLGGVLLVILLVVGGQVLASRRRPSKGTPEGGHTYGVLGGGICPKCGRPTPFHVTGINLVTGKYDRCENCGRWSFIRSVPVDRLRDMEAAQAEAEKAAARPPQESAEQKRREMLDNSKYTD
jgi:hypothetical protein